VNNVMRIVDIARGNLQNRLNMRGRVLLIGQRRLKAVSILSAYCSHNNLQLCCFEQISACFTCFSFSLTISLHTEITLNTTLSLHLLRANKAAHVKHGKALLYYSHVKPL
jgi:hypothetical protein